MASSLYWRRTQAIAEKDTLPTLLDLEAFRACPLTRVPFDFLVVRDFVRAEARPAIDRAFPQVRRGGSFPVEVLRYGKMSRTREKRYLRNTARATVSPVLPRLQP